MRPETDVHRQRHRGNLYPQAARYALTHSIPGHESPPAAPRWGPLTELRPSPPARVGRPKPTPPTFRRKLFYHASYATGGALGVLCPMLWLSRGVRKSDINTAAGISIAALCALTTIGGLAMAGVAYGLGAYTTRCCEVPQQALRRALVNNDAAALRAVLDRCAAAQRRRCIAALRPHDFFQAVQHEALSVLTLLIDIAPDLVGQHMDGQDADMPTSAYVHAITHGSTELAVLLLNKLP